MVDIWKPVHGLFSSGKVWARVLATEISLYYIDCAIYKRLVLKRLAPHYIDKGPGILTVHLSKPSMYLA